MMRTATLIRKDYQEKQVLGELVMDNGKKLLTLELAWRDNKPQVSCIPKGVYDVVTRTSAKYGKHFHITNVPNRSFILFHSGNYYTQILGCVLVGTKYQDINKDGITDILNSKAAMSELLKTYPNGFKLTIK